MNKYDIIVEALQDQVNYGNITLEFAEAVNDLAFTDFMFESSLDDDTFEEYFNIAESVLKSDDDGKRTISSNQVYIGAFKKATELYKSNVKDIKSSIKDKKFDDALKKIKESEGILKNLKSQVMDTPESITENEVNELAKFLSKALIITTIFSVIFYIAKRYEEEHNGIIDMKEVEIKPKKGEKYAIMDPNNKTKFVRKSRGEATAEFSKEFFKDLISENKSQVAIGAAVVALSTMAANEKGKLSYMNNYKKTAIKGIESEIKSLNKLEKKCIKLKEKINK